MDYEHCKKQLLKLKKNTEKLTQKERMEELLKMICQYPDAYTIMHNFGIIDTDRIIILKSKGLRGTALQKAIMDSIEIKTPNSDDLSLKLFGYIKPITPAELDRYIDEVFDKVNVQLQFFNWQDEEMNKEDQLTLGEIEQFT